MRGIILSRTLDLACDQWAQSPAPANARASVSTLLQTLNDYGVESTNVLRERVAVGLESVQDQLDQVMESADEAAASIGELIEQHPWAAIGVAAGLGTAAGCAATAGGYVIFAPRRTTGGVLRRSWRRALAGWSHSL